MNVCLSCPHRRCDLQSGCRARGPGAVASRLARVLPVVTLGFGAALTHPLRDDVAEDVPEVVPAPALHDDAGTVAAVTADAVPTPVPDAVAGTVARRARRRPVNGHAKKAERKYATDLAEGRMPSLRAVMRDIGVGQDKAREVRAHLATLTAANGTVNHG
jgi:hypothetical protein